MTTRLLLLEDRATDAELVLREVRRTFPDLDARRVADLADFERELVLFRPDVVLSDHHLPGFTGRDALAVAMRLAPDTPFILVTGSQDEEVAVDYMKAGAADYLLKDRTARLGPAVAAALQSRRERDEQARIRLAAEEALRTQGEFLRAVIDLTPNLVFVKDREGRFVLANRALAELYGATTAEVEGKTDVDFGIEPEEAERFRRDDQEVIDGGRPKLIAEELLTSARTGKRHWFQTVKIPVRLPGHEIPLVLGISTDITERRNLEEQLRLAQKMEAVGTLAGGIAHDFNNLLAAIKATAELILQDMTGDSPFRNDLMEIVSIVDRAGALTRQLLAFGRKQVLAQRVVDLREIVESTVSMLRRLIGEDIRLTVQQESSPLTISADPGQVEQVLMNLCVNARDAMPQGGELAILADRFAMDEHFCETHPWARPGDYVRLTVSDTGLGMDEAVRSRIFEPFFTTKQVGRGTGLGLAVVYGIIKQHGGLIHVYSEPGHGTTFKVYLPFVAEPAAPRAAEGERRIVGGTERILLAEDDASLRAVACRLLRRIGYTVVEASNGREALRTLETDDGNFDLAILDVVMPELPGVAVFEAARRKHPDLRFLFTSGYSPGTSRFGPLEGLPADFLGKPYGIQELSAAVRMALDRR